MSILRPRDPAVIAVVEVNDDYRVELRTDRKLTDYSPDEAEDLADELIHAASEARRKYAADQRASIHPIGLHGFDTDGPVHPECRAGKCGNCDGQTMNGRDEMVPCTHGCHEAVVWDGRGSVDFLASNEHVHDPSGACLKNRHGHRCDRLAEGESA